jgi:imidazolonepropionase-like amidohydrolase
MIASATIERSRLVIHRGLLLDIDTGSYRGIVDVLIEGERIIEISEEPISAPDAVVIKAHGRVLLPGLIDAHVHVMGVTLDLSGLARMPPYLVAGKAKVVLEGMLRRGFTTVRDAGGAERGLREAVAGGYFIGPRLFVSDLALAEPHGQGDFRAAGEPHLGCPVCRGARSITRIVDGPDAMRQAVREQLEDGVDQIKLMASGGIASNVPIDRPQFSLEEISIAVEEAKRRGSYVMAHVYESTAIRRCIEQGVRSLEHAGLIDEETARLAAAKDVFIVPTLAVFEALSEAGRSLGYSSEKIDRISRLLRESLDGLERARAAGVRIGHGSDLEGQFHDNQSREFFLKAEVLSPLETIRAATTTNASLLGMPKKLGEISEGAFADVLIVDGDPLVDIGCLGEPEHHIRVIVKSGSIYKNDL